jgi:hypothetical protein
MDVRKIRGEDFIFPLSTDYNNKTQYALIAQSAERVLGKDEVSSSNLLESSKGLKPLMYLSFRYVEGFRFLRYEHNGTVTPVLVLPFLLFCLLLFQKNKGEMVK